MHNNKLEILRIVRVDEYGDLVTIVRSKRDPNACEQTNDKPALRLVEFPIKAEREYAAAA